MIERRRILVQGEILVVEYDPETHPTGYISMYQAKALLIHSKGFDHRSWSGWSKMANIQVEGRRNRHPFFRTSDTGGWDYSGWSKRDEEEFNAVKVIGPDPLAFLEKAVRLTREANEERRKFLDRLKSL